jgi:hypothetical protein
MKGYCFQNIQPSSTSLMLIPTALFLFDREIEAFLLQD